MLYMISIKGNKMIKVGYTTDFKERERKYWTAMANALQVIDVIEGDRVDEINYHLVLEYLGFERVDDERETEWFKIPTSIQKDRIVELGFKMFDFKAD